MNGGKEGKSLLDHEKTDDGAFWVASKYGNSWLYSMDGVRRQHRYVSYCGAPLES